MLCITVLCSFSVFLFKMESFYSPYIVFFVFHTGGIHIQTNIDALGFSWNPKLMSSLRSSSLGTEDTRLFSSEALWDMRTKLHCLVLKRWCRTQRIRRMMSPYFSRATGQWGSAAALLCGWGPVLGPPLMSSGDVDSFLQKDAVGLLHPPPGGNDLSPGACFPYR